MGERAAGRARARSPSFPRLPPSHSLHHHQLTRHVWCTASRPGLAGLSALRLPCMTGVPRCGGDDAAHSVGLSVSELLFS